MCSCVIWEGLTASISPLNSLLSLSSNEVTFWSHLLKVWGACIAHAWCITVTLKNVAATIGDEGSTLSRRGESWFSAFPSWKGFQVTSPIFWFPVVNPCKKEHETHTVKLVKKCSWSLQWTSPLNYSQWLLNKNTQDFPYAYPPVATEQGAHVLANNEAL